MRRPLSNFLVIVVAGLAPFAAFGGAQQYEVLSASVRATMARAVNDRGTVDIKDMDTRAWVRGMTRRVINKFPDEDAARQFLALVRYESMRAGLDPHLVLAVIDVESKFRKYAVSKSGARGLMQVMPFWVKELGESAQQGQNLFQERINLRYGCTILRHYLDRERGNTANALARYNGSLGQPDYPNRVFAAYRDRWALTAQAALPGGALDVVASSSDFFVTRPGLSYTTFPLGS